VSPAFVLLGRLAESAEALTRGGYLLVQDGEGFEELPETLQLRTGVSARVVRVDAELKLRHALWRLRPAPVIALVPEGLVLPADLLLTAARQRVHTLTGDEILSALLNTRVTGADDEDLRRLALDHIEQLQAVLSTRTTPTVIDRALLERTLLEVVADLQDLRVADGRTAELFARWLQAPPAWPPAVARLARSALEQHGDPGRLLAWALQDPAARCRALFVHGAIFGVEDELPASVWGPLAPLRDPATSPLRVPALARTCVDRLVQEAAVHIGHAARPLLDEADTLARRLLPTAQLQTSDLLPLSFEERAHAIATTLAKGEAPPREALRRLRQHALARTSERRLELIDDLDRLVRYLHRHRGPPLPAAAIAVSYLHDHAHADRCARRVVRTLASVPAHHAEARAVLALVYADRDATNRAFAEALAGGYATALYDQRLVALPNLVRDVLVERQQEGARVFLLVLDGCSVPVFLDLLDQLAQPRHNVGLERGPGMRLRLQPGVAPLPTITSHARGALFLGAIPKDPFAAETVWREGGERVTDPARFKQNPALQGQERQLFLKGDLADGGGALQAALRGPTPVVAAVFNAVDDRIASHDTGAAWRLDVEDVTGLLPALQAALDARRKVLVTADHGHTPFRGLDLRVGAGSTPRFVRLKAGEEVPAGFIELDCGALAGEPGRTAYAWRSGVYRGAVQVGFHGGCALEEMVVPVAWLARAGSPADPPPWWFEGAALPPLAPPTPLAAPALPRSAPPVAAPQELPFPSAAQERLPILLRVALEPSAAEVVAWILADGPIRTSVIARRLGRPVHRVQQWLAQLNRTLAPHGARLAPEALPDLEQQWRYEGPEEGA
jgi:hypothetical protein